jgi:hypothetical protein
MVAHRSLEIFGGDRNLCARTEGVLLPLVYDHLRGLQQSGQRGLGRVGRVRLELSLEVFLEQFVGTIVLVGILVVGEGLRELGKECGLMLLSSGMSQR